VFKDDSQISGEGSAGGLGTIDIPTTDALTEEFKNIQDQGTREVAIIGSRNLSMSHIKIIEMIAFGLTAAGSTIVTSGGSSGTNYAAIKGALRGNADKLKVVLPQTIEQQPKEIQDELIGVKYIIEHKERANMLLADASRLCNQEIISESQQLICFLYRDSFTLLDALDYAHSLNKIVTTFYLD
jgi:hypothetical protein